MSEVDVLVDVVEAVEALKAGWAPRIGRRGCVPSGAGVDAKDVAVESVLDAVEDGTVDEAAPVVVGGGAAIDRVDGGSGRPASAGSGTWAGTESEASELVKLGRGGLESGRDA